MDNERIRNLIENRTKTHHGIYSDIGTALENVSTADLIRYYIEVVQNGNDGDVRYYVEQQIISGEINKLRYNAG